MSRLQSIARKLRLIAGSDLVAGDKLRYVLQAAGLGPGLFACRLRGGDRVVLRKGTTDPKVFDEIFLERAYGPCVAALPDNLGRVNLIDLGANIGLSALYLARALDIGEIIAVEPDPGNFARLSENLRTAGLTSRTTALQAFAGAARGLAELHDSGNGAWGMRMGPLSDTGTPVLPLAEIAGAVKSSLPLVLKCDIEGGERELFLHAGDWDHLVHFILLELHTEFLPVEEMRTCLESSSFHWTIHGTAAPEASIVLLMLERGNRRNP